MHKNLVVKGRVWTVFRRHLWGIFHMCHSQNFSPMTHKMYHCWSYGPKKPYPLKSKKGMCSAFIFKTYFLKFLPSLIFNVNFKQLYLLASFITYMLKIRYVKHAVVYSACLQQNWKVAYDSPLQLDFKTFLEKLL